MPGGQRNQSRGTPWLIMLERFQKCSNRPCPCKQGGRNLELNLVGWSSGRVCTSWHFHPFWNYLHIFTLHKRTHRGERWKGGRAKAEARWPEESKQKDTVTYHACKIPKCSNTPCPCKQGGRNLELNLAGWSSGRVFTFLPVHPFTFFTFSLVHLATKNKDVKGEKCRGQRNQRRRTPSCWKASEVL